MSRRTADPKVTSPIPRDVLVALLGRARRGEGQRDEASDGEAAPADRASSTTEMPEGEEAVVAPPTIVPPPPTIVHHASIEAWLASKR